MDALCPDTYTKEDFTEFLNLMQSICGFPIWQHESLASVAVHLAQNRHCYDGVYECSGIVSAFIQKCSKGPIVQNIADNLKISKDIIDIDINSSYGSAIVAMGGIPKGKPQPFTSSIPQDSTVWFAQIHIHSVKCKLSNDPFPLIKHEGLIFTNSIVFNQILRYYDVQYEIINGYSFNQGFNSNICTLVTDLYSNRLKYPQYSKTFKFLISTLFGRSLFSESPIKTISCTEQDLHKTLARVGARLFSYKSKRGGKYEVNYIKSFNFSYCIPQFGSLILSQGKVSIYNIVYGILKGQNVYRINTDSIIMDYEAFTKNNLSQLIGEGLGKFKIEFNASYLHLINSSSYLAQTSEGIRARGVAARKLNSNQI